MIEATTKVIASTPERHPQPHLERDAPDERADEPGDGLAELIRANACISRDGGMTVANIELSAPSWKARNAQQTEGQRQDRPLVPAVGVRHDGEGEEHGGARRAAPEHHRA